MEGSGINAERFQATFLLLLVVAISLLFFSMVRSFLMALFLAAIFSGLLYGLYKRLLGWLKGREALACIATTSRCTRTNSKTASPTVRQSTFWSPAS